MTREFPDDENGTVLRGMLDSGDDLSRPRQIDFTVVLPGELQAQELAEVFRRRGFEVSLKRTDVVPELPWDVTISSFMLPDHQAIADMENALQIIATPLGGKNDGWGCFERPAADH